MMIFVLLFFGTGLIASFWKWFVYYCFSRGLLYHIEKAHPGEIDLAKAKDIQAEAMRRVLLERFKGCIF